MMKNRLMTIGSWCQRIRLDWEVVLAVVTATAILTLLVLVFTSRFVLAEACLSIDVDPRHVVREMDGDTIPIFTFAPGGEVKIRVQGVDTPEREEPGWGEARAFTKAWLQRGPFKVMTCGKRTFDRIEGVVERDGVSLADELRAAGLERMQTP